MAGLTHIPAVVRGLTGAEALEMAVTENLQREDVPPLEEAAGYERLHKAYGYGVDEIADKVGKSKTYVYSRLKLTSLCEEAKDLVQAHALSATVALLIARIPVPSEQAEAAKRCAAGPDGQPLSATRAAHLIQQTYMRRLEFSPFPVADVALIPSAGSCGMCPKRTGNQPELFGDIQDADTCTDGQCYEAKRSRWFEAQAEAHEAKGGRVWRTGSEEWKQRWSLRRPDDKCPIDSSGRTWGEIMTTAHKRKQPPLPVLYQSFADDLQWERGWPLEEAHAWAAKLGIEQHAEEDEVGDGGEAGDDRAKGKTWEKRQRAMREWHDQAVAKIAAHPPTEAECRMWLMFALRQVWQDGDAAIVKDDLARIGVLLVDNDDGLEEDDVRADVEKLRGPVAAEAFRVVALKSFEGLEAVATIAAELGVDVGERPE